MKCPGQDMQYWNESAIFEVECPQCSKPVEFYKDDTSRKCSHCGNRFVNPNMDFGCASYCQFAEQCLGTLPEDFEGVRENLLKDKVAVEMKRHYKTDFKRISRAMKIARHAENIGKSEGGSLAAVLCSAYLLEMGDSVAQVILKELSADQKTIEKVIEIISQHTRSETPSTLEAKIVYDAVLLQRLYDAGPAEKTQSLEIDTERLFTQTAKNIGKEAVS